MNIPKKYLSYLIAILFTLSCNRKIKNNTAPLQEVAATHESFLVMQDSSILKNSIIREFYFHDSVYFGHILLLNKLETKLIINSPVLLLQADNNWQIPYLIYPGEKITLKTDYDSTIIFTIPENVKRTNELNFFRLLVKKYGIINNNLPNKAFHKKVETINELQNLQSNIYNLKLLRLNFLDSFVDRCPVTGNFYNVASSIIASAALKDTLLLYFNNRVALKNKNFLSDLVNEKIKSLKDMGFKNNYVYYSTCAATVSMLTTKYFEYELQDSSDVAKRFSFVGQNFDGFVRDFLLANTLVTAYTKGLGVSKQQLQYFETKCTDSGYKKIVTSEISDQQLIKYPKGTGNLMLADGKTIQTIQSVIDSHKGSVVLFDFWASWCAPCRAEMPYSSMLEKQYKGKNVAFIYVSVDGTIGDWRTANQEEGLGMQNSYLLLRPEMSSFVAQYAIHSIPRYILFGKDGKIVNVDSPRPRDPKLITLFEKYSQ